MPHINLTAAEVRGYLERGKTQIRRPIEPQFGKLWGCGVRWGTDVFSAHVDILVPNGEWKWINCPYGQPGDVLKLIGPYGEEFDRPITTIRVQRVQEVSDKEIRAEGFYGGGVNGRRELFTRVYRGSWDRNDWVWVIETEPMGGEV